MGAPLAGIHPPPILTWQGGTLGGCPPGWGTPHPDLGGTPGGHLLAGVPPILTWGYPGWVSPGWGTPPPTGVDRLKTLPSLILRMRSVIKLMSDGGAVYRLKSFQNGFLRTRDSKNIKFPKKTFVIYLLIFANSSNSFKYFKDINVVHMKLQEERVLTKHLMSVSLFLLVPPSTNTFAISSK